MPILGKRIAVVGVSASGKSSFSRKLADKTGLPLIPTDSVMWKPGWSYLGDGEIVKKLEETSSAPEWIIEGYIVKEARASVFDRADTILYLDYPSVVASWRYIKRWWFHRKHARPELEGSPDTFSFRFLTLVLSKGEAVSLRQSLKKVENQKKIITLSTPAEAKKLLHNTITPEKPAGE